MTLPNFLNDLKGLATPKTKQHLKLYKGGFYVSLDGGSPFTQSHRQREWQAQGWRTEGQIKKLARKRQIVAARKLEALKQVS